MTPVAQPRAFTVSNWKPFEKNTLRGFLSLTTPSGMILHGCSYHVKSDGGHTSRWIALPAQKITKGTVVTYSPVVEFTTKELRDRFSEAALAAFDAAGVI